MNHTLLVICHRCPKRQRDCMGPCACTIDGADIREHAKSEQCPDHRYTRPRLGPTEAELEAQGYDPATDFHSNGCDCGGPADWSGE